MTFKLKLSVLSIKITVALKKMFGNPPADYVGEVCLRIFPGFMQNFLKEITLPEHMVFVVGSDGKSTVHNLITECMKGTEHLLLENSEHDKGLKGIATLLFENTTSAGIPKINTAVFEIKEEELETVLKLIKPSHLVCTNISRPNYAVNGEVSCEIDLAKVISRSISSDTKFILCGDDAASFNLCPQNERAYYGISVLEEEETALYAGYNKDVVVCPLCGSIVEYDMYRFGNHGKFHCTNDGCDFKNPEEIKYSVEKFTLDTATYTFNKLNILLPDTSLHNIYNFSAAISFLSEFGLNFPKIKDGLKNAKIRNKTWELIGASIIHYNFVNADSPISLSLAFDEVRAAVGTKSVVLLFDYEKLIDMYDADFEFLRHENISAVYCKDNIDLQLRLLIAGIDEEKISDISEFDISGTNEVFVLYNDDSELEKFKSKIK
ncbi:MAG: hypothetical protein LBL93_03565 [Ruminococcus sp.]|jgi:UDP-N-acetylmuramoyl-L-alanyl-D-glutamate--2,6-diaminopimelate ligase|nr:hypothetical protein [Ruminococcus sp.]